jgi:cell division septal protein FtsQ
MPRRRTTRVLPKNRSRVLQARIYSPRIFWYTTLKWLTRLFKFAFLFALVGGAGYAIWDYGKKNFLENPQYELRVIKLSPNNAFDESDVVTIADIPLNESIFGISLSKVEECLRARPEITSATVTRELPGTIRIDVTVRQPFAWIECRARQMEGRSREKGYLIDREGVLYRCPALQYDAAVVLPVIVIATEEAGLLVPGERIESKTMKRSLRLLTIAEPMTRSDLPWIDSVEPYQPWAMKVWTRDGIEAIFGLEDHQVQMENLFLSMKHAREKGLHIASINLIPERNLPVILRSNDSQSPLRVRPQGPAGVHAIEQP